MKQLMVILFIFLIANTSFAGDDWDTVEKCMYGTKLAFHTVDMLQTSYIYNNDNYYEVNPLIDFSVDKIGKVAIPIWFVSTGVLDYFIADYLSHPYRKAFLAGSTAISVGLVAHNNSIGIGLNFKF